MDALLVTKIRPAVLLLGVVLAGAAWLSSTAPPVVAGPGDLDGSFGGSGMVTSDLGGSDEARAVTIDRSGRLIVAGVTDAGTGTFMFALTRYTLDGTLDSSFGNSGIVTTPVGDGDAVGNAVTVQPDGRIVAAGYMGVSGAYDIVLVRYNTDGSLDGSFGSGGIVITSLSVGDDIARDVSVHPQGGLVVAGTSDGRNLVLIRYGADGSVDASFGRDGVASTALSGLGGTFDLNVQEDGVVVATIAGDLFRAVFYVNGRFDVRIARTLAPGFDRTNSVIPIGANTLMGIAGVAGGQFAVGVYRYDLPGTNTEPYTEFGGSGIVVADFGRESAALGLLLLSDRRIVAVGQAGYDFAVAVYTGVMPPAATPPSSPPPPTPITSPPASAMPAPSPAAPVSTRFVGTDSGNLARIEFRTNATGTLVEGTITTMRDIPCTGQGGTVRLTALLFQHEIRPDGSFAGITDVRAQPTGTISLTIDARIEGNVARGTFSLRVSSSGCTTARHTFEARVLP